MQIPKIVIEKAIEGGWKDSAVDVHTSASDVWEIVALDATFWQALGKALGWDKPRTYWREAMSVTSEVYSYNTRRLENEAHTFYDLILTGKDTTDYWNDILGV